MTGEPTEVLGLEKWGDKQGQPNCPAIKKPKVQNTVSIPSKCSKCGAEFPSRSKMFKHIRETHDIE